MGRGDALRRSPPLGFAVMTGLKRNRHHLGEIDRFLCPLVGTCLTLKETQKIARHFQYVGDTSAYKLHVWIIDACRRLPVVAKYVQKFLDRKYRLAINRIDACAGRELNLAWQEALKEGQIAGAFYAITTRVDTPDDVLHGVFGDIHMMSHIQGAEARAELKEFGRLRQANEALQDRVKRLTGQVETVKSVREELQRQLSGKEAELADLRRKLGHLEQNLISLNAGPEIHQLRAANQKLAVRLSQEQRTRQKLEFRLMQETVRQLPRPPLALETRVADTDESAPPEEVCPLAEGGNCPQFCNKCILFVGGLDRMEPHYRSLVENEFGAKFMRHDGDCHSGQDRLIHMVQRAEAVICPLNCNSHRACLCVKKICKDLNKPCVLMRNSGLGSLKRSLLDLAGPGDMRVG